MLIDITVRRSVNAPGRCSCQFKSWALGITGQYNEENFNENAGCRLVAYAKHELPLVPPSYAARLGCSPLVSLTSAGEKAWEPFIANFTAAADCGPIDTVTVYINQARPTFRQRRSARSPLSPLQHRRTRCYPSLVRTHQESSTYSSVVSELRMALVKECCCARSTAPLCRVRPRAVAA